MIVNVLSPWIGKGTEEDPYRPAFFDDYTGTHEDITGQEAVREQNRPDLLPKAVMVKAEMEEDVYEVLSTDEDFCILGKPGSKLDEEAVSVGRIYLAKKCGLSDIQVDMVLPTGGAGVDPVVLMKDGLKAIA